jgi:hypothetical protein
MTIRVARLLVVVALSLAGTIAAAAPGLAAVPGHGSFTTITTPSKTTVFRLDGSSGANDLTIAGQASLDITEVNIVCVYSASDGVRFVTIANNTPVTGGSFSATATLPSAPANCRLRAVPTGTNLTDYLGSYSGPILYTDDLTPTFDGTPTEYDFNAAMEEGDGFAQAQSAGACGIKVMASIPTPGMTLGPINNGCMFGLTEGNIDSSGTSTESAVKVDGHNAFMPYGVQSYLIDDLFLPVTQPAITATMSVASNNDITVTETAPLMRCSVSNVYPPTVTSCPSLIPTGVQFQRTMRASRLGYQIFCQDTFRSVDSAAHSLSLEYQGSLAAPPTGRTGFIFPNHSGTFAVTTPDETVSGFTGSAASMFVRSDLNASVDDPSANSFGITWSKAPSVIAFGHTNPNSFAMRYALSVPASGQANLAFAESQSPTTAAVMTLASSAVSEMMTAPTITAPANGATVPTEATTVRGAITAGANGLPTTVTVNGHTATITRTSSTAATYRSTFTQTWGTHTVTVTARDSAGNMSKKSITEHNTPALAFTGRAHVSGSKLKVPVTCKRYATASCTGKLVVKNKTGTTAGSAASFTVARGATKTVRIALSHPTHKGTISLYQREPNGTFPLDARRTATL